MPQFTKKYATTTVPNVLATSGPAQRSFQPLSHPYCSCPNPRPFSTWFQSYLHSPTPAPSPAYWGFTDQDIDNDTNGKFAWILTRGVDGELASEHLIASSIVFGINCNAFEGF